MVEGREFEGEREDEALPWRIRPWKVREQAAAASGRTKKKESREEGEKNGDARIYTPESRTVAPRGPRSDVAGPTQWRIGMRDQPAHLWPLPSMHDGAVLTSSPVASDANRRLPHLLGTAE